MSDIDSVEILGGGVRVPRVKEELHKIFGDMEVRETCERDLRERATLYIWEYNMQCSENMYTPEKRSSSP
jgi:hypothetical protein